MTDKPTCRVYDIKTYAIHDGPGIRTTVFFKGCPLNCLWCHNPEGITHERRLVYNNKTCIGCKTCCDTCPGKALALTPSGIDIRRDICTLCGLCAGACPAGAIEIQGRDWSIDELVAEVEKDMIFFDSSGGGVTFSGGEPLAQGRALIELLSACRERAIHTVVDTSGCGSWEILSEASGLASLFLYDIKHMDDARHKAATGVSNGLILSNLEKLSRKGVPIIIRFPMIPGINDDTENVEKMGVFLAGLSNIRRVEVMPYHDFHISKYNKLGIPYQLTATRVPSKERVGQVAEKLTDFGLRVETL